MSIDTLRQKYIRYITWIDLYLKSASSALNDQSLNVHIEYTMIRLLNLAYGYKLRNANIETSNVMAIDAFDNLNHVCFQITSNTRFNKIYNTIHNFVSDRLFEKYGTLFFFTLGKRQNLVNINLIK